MIKKLFLYLGSKVSCWQVDLKEGKKKKKRCLARNKKIIETRQLNLNQNTEVAVGFFLFAERLTKPSITAELPGLRCIKCVVFMESSHTI